MKAIRLIALFVFLIPLVADGAAIRTNGGFASNTLARNDDSYTGFVPFGFTLDFYGNSRTGGYVNNNGNVTLDSPMSTFTPFPLLSTSREILAPFFSDVDTRYHGDPVKYGTDTVDGHAAFGVNWINADYYASSTSHTLSNDFQLVIIDRSDINPGDFDFEFNFDQIQWETGDASSGTGGLGGDSARVGWSNGTTDSYELAGSAVNGALLDGGADSLTAGSLNSSVAGRYVFRVRNGSVDPTVPEPTTLAIWSALGGLGMMFAARRRRKQVA